MIVAVSGGFRTTVGGFRISARSPLPIAFLALINLTMWLSAARRAQSIQSDLELAWQRLERHSTSLIVGIALIVAVVVASLSTFSAAGADASGYVSQAEMWTRGARFTFDPLIVELQQPDGWLTTPLGWRPASVLALQAPTYPPGLPLLMAIPRTIGGVAGASSIVIFSAVLAVLATGFLTIHLAGRTAGLIAATFLAFAPVFIHQSIQPMSDVPVTAAWMVCFLLLSLRNAALDSFAGTACAAAVLIRPNLGPLALVPLVLAQRKIAFSIPVVIAGAFLAVMQWLWYGSPLRSGYGSAEELFALSNIGANASRYSTWLMTTSPVLLLAIFGFNRFKRDRLSRGMLAFAMLVIASYLVYAVFDAWSYLRFLLPALAIFAVFAAAELSAWLTRWPVAVRAPLLFTLLLGVAAFGVFTARSHDTFKLADQLRRVERVADFINSSVPENAVILSGEQSGSMRYYTHRPILRWEAATPESLTAAIATLEKLGRPVYIALDAWENEPFRAKFSTLPAVALDWPPVLEAGTSHRTRLWKIGDRDRFMRGEPLNIIRVP